MKPAFGYNDSTKIVSKNVLRALSRQLHRQGKRIVTTNGSFDILHAGHLHLLYRARNLGDILIVGLNSDASIQKYKSKDRPIIKQRFRAQLLAALSVVDYVYIFPEVNPIQFLSIVQPHIHVNSAQYGKRCIEAPTVKRYGGRLVLVAVQKSLLSTSSIIQKILRVYHR